MPSLLAGMEEAMEADYGNMSCVHIATLVSGFAEIALTTWEGRRFYSTKSLLAEASEYFRCLFITSGMVETREVDRPVEIRLPEHLDSAVFWRAFHHLLLPGSHAATPSVVHPHVDRETAGHGPAMEDASSEHRIAEDVTVRGAGASPHAGVASCCLGAELASWVICWSLADQLLLASVMDRCHQAVTARIQEGNCVALLQAAEAFCLPGLRAAVHDWMCEHFELFSSDPHFYRHVPPGDLAAVLMRDDLAVLRPESAVLALVAEWLTENSGCSLDDALPVLRCVRYPLVDTLELLRAAAHLRSLLLGAATPLTPGAPLAPIAWACPGWMDGGSARHAHGDGEACNKESGASAADGSMGVPPSGAQAARQPPDGGLFPRGWAEMMLRTVTEVLRQRGASCPDGADRVPMAGICFHPTPALAPVAAAASVGTSRRALAPFCLGVSVPPVGVAAPVAGRVPVPAGAVEQGPVCAAETGACACAGATQGVCIDERYNCKYLCAQRVGHHHAEDSAGSRVADASTDDLSWCRAQAPGGQFLVPTLHLQPHQFSARQPRRRGTIRLALHTWGKDREVVSGTFLLGGCSWQLVGYPRGHASASEKFVSIFLRCVSMGHAPHTPEGGHRPCCAPPPQECCGRVRRSSWEGPCRAGWPHATSPSVSLPQAALTLPTLPAPSAQLPSPTPMGHDPCCYCGRANASNSSDGALGQSMSLVRPDMRYRRHVRYAFTVMAPPPASSALRSESKGCLGLVEAPPPSRLVLGMPGEASAVATLPGRDAGLCGASTGGTGDRLRCVELPSAPPEAQAHDGSAPASESGATLGLLVPIMKQEDHAWFIPTVADEWGFRNFVPLCDMPKLAVHGRLLVDVDMCVEMT